MKSNELLQRTIDHYGPDKQIVVFLGELGELYEAVRHGTSNDVVDELADVIIMVTQRVMIADIPTPTPIPVKLAALPVLAVAIAKINKYEARLVQGREYTWEPIRVLLGWIDTLEREMSCSGLIANRIKFKLERLQERLDAIQEN